MENIFAISSSLASASPPAYLNHFNFLHLRSATAPRDSTNAILFHSGYLQCCTTAKAVRGRLSSWHGVQLGDNAVEVNKKHRQLIILDLNGVLIRAYPRDQELNVSEEPALYLKHKKIYFRPELTYFIDRCLSTYEVAIWSCFSLSNIKYILKRSIGKERMDKLLFIWDQKKCSLEGYMADFDGQQRPRLLKNIQKVSEYFPRFGPENILMIDDSEYKLKNNTRWRYICPKSFDPEDYKTNQSSILLWERINHYLYHSKKNHYLLNVK